MGAFDAISVGAWVGIGVGILLIILLIVVGVIVILVLCLRKKKKECRKSKPLSDPELKQTQPSTWGEGMVSIAPPTSKAATEVTATENSTLPPTSVWNRGGASVQTTPSKVDQNFKTEQSTSQM